MGMTSLLWPLTLPASHWHFSFGEDIPQLLEHPPGLSAALASLQYVCPEKLETSLTCQAWWMAKEVKIKTMKFIQRKQS